MLVHISLNTYESKGVPKVHVDFFLGFLSQRKEYVEFGEMIHNMANIPVTIYLFLLHAHQVYL